MLLLYLIAGAIGLVWGAWFLLRGSLVAGCLVYLLATVCFSYEFWHLNLGGLPLTLDRLLLPLLLAAYVVHRWLGRADPKPIGKIDLVLAAFLGVVALSSLWGEHNAMGGKAAFLLRLLGAYLVPTMLYWIARQSPLGRREVTWIHAALAGMAVYLAVTGLLEITHQWWAVFPKYIANPKVGLHFGRARGPMVEAVSFGMYLAIGMLAVLVWQGRFGRFGRLVLLSLVPLMLAGVYFSYTRSVWIGVTLGLLVVLGMTLQGTWRHLALGGMVCAGLLLAATRMDSLVGLHREQKPAEAGSSVHLRGTLAYVSWKMFLDRPLLGFGFNQFPRAKLAYLSDRSTHLVLESARPYVHHNTLLSLLTETGIVGLSLYLVVLGGWARAAWRLARAPQAARWAQGHGVLMLGALAVYLCQALFHEISYLPVQNALVFFLAGTVVGLARRVDMTPA